MTNKNDDDNFLIYTEIDELDTHLDQTFNAFKKQTADPVWLLREDLQYWVGEFVGAGEVHPGEHPDVIKQQVIQKSLKLRHRTTLTFNFAFITALIQSGRFSERATKINSGKTGK